MQIPTLINKKCITVHDQLNSLLLLSNADPLERKKDHSAYQVTEQVRSRGAAKERGWGAVGFCLWHLLWEP